MRTRSGGEAHGAPDPVGNGFTLLEVLFVAVLGIITLGIAAQSYVGYVERTAAEHGAKIFARDLSMARSTAARRRQEVVVRFDESALSYEIETESGVVVARRSYGDGDDISLSSVDLEMPGDSVVFDARGIADLSGLAATLAEAHFRAGQRTFTVHFNSLGGARVDES